MLRSFRLGNHRSFRDEQEILLMPVYDRDRLALPVTAVYGANASGKSNILDGLRFMVGAVVDSYAMWEPEGGVPRQPFRLSKASRTEPSVFVVEIVLDGVRHTYGLTVDDERVREEWLYSYPEKRRRVIFEREGEDIKFGSTLQVQRAMADILEELTRPNALFLGVGVKANFAPLLPVYEWFREGVKFAGEERSWLDISRMAARFFENSSDERRQLLVKLLQLADLGITGIRIDSGPRARQRFRFAHGDGTEWFELGDESAGTRVWLGLLPTALRCLEQGSVMVVDEIDASLHPGLTAQLIRLFRESDSNPRGAQLVFNTHDTSLLSPVLGDDILRRDEIWFVEKDESGASRLYPLSDFHPRKGENTERRYLGGSYGAVPTVFEEDFAAAVHASGLVGGARGQA